MKPVTSSPSNNELLEQMRRGSEAAFVAIYRRCQGVVYRYALQMCGSAALAEDVTQETFMALIRNNGRFDPDRGTLQAYLVGIARNHLARSREWGRQHISLENEDGEQATVVEGMVALDDPLRDVTHGERLGALKQAVVALPLHYREVVFLCDLEEMSYLEAAAALGCAVGTVRSRLHRAHELLTERLRGRGASEAIAEGMKSSRCLA